MARNRRSLSRTAAFALFRSVISRITTTAPSFSPEGATMALPLALRIRVAAPSGAIAISTSRTISP